MIKRNLMFADFGGSVIVVADTLHEKNGDYVEVARIEKKTGNVKWYLSKGLNSENENLEKHEKLKGTIREVVERYSEKYRAV